MHAGDALWYLYAGLELFDRKHSDEPDYLMLVQRLRECAGVIGKQIAIPEPPTTKMSELIDQLMVQESPEAAEFRTMLDEAPPPERPKIGRGEDDENIEFALVLLDEMVACGEFEWSEFVTDLHDRLHKPNAFFTPKQWRGIIRTAQKSNFWDRFEEEYSTCAAHGMSLAEEADRQGG